MSSLYFDLTLLHVIPTVEFDMLVSTYCHATEESSIGQAYSQSCAEAMLVLHQRHWVTLTFAKT